MARKAKKAKPKRKAARKAMGTSAITNRLVALQMRVADLEGWQAVMPTPVQCQLLRDQVRNLHGVLNEVTAAVDRLLAGHSGDAAAHAALAPAAEEQTA